jgi:hypothetical protein
LVLRDLLGRGKDDREVRELVRLRDSDPLILNLLSLQNEDGSWREGEGGGETLGKIRLTAQALMGLGYMGLDSGHPAVRRGAEFLFSRQQPDGSWPLPTQSALLDANRVSDIKYHMIPLQTALPLLGLARAGFATDGRAEKAYDWLISRRLPQGGWPSGMHRDTYIFAAGYRRLAHSRFGCRTNTTAAVSALSLHPRRRMEQAARRGLDLLLAHEQRQAHTLGFEVARLIGAESTRGGFTYFKRYDVAQILDLCWRVEAGPEDERIAENIAFVKELQGPYGLWSYAPRPEASRWISFDLLRSLSRIDRETDWISTEPRTPFQPYPKKPRRF